MSDDVPYPDRPKRPEILRKPANDLTMEEIRSLPRAKAAYTTAMAKYGAAMERWREAERAEIAACRARCEEEFGMAGHAKADKLWERAWQEGHSEGLERVYEKYRELAEQLADE